MKLVLIEWVDSHSGSPGWQPLDQIAEETSPTKCRSVGWLVRDAAGAKTLVPHISGEKNSDVRPYGRGDITIPNSCITKMRVLARE